MNWWHCRRRRFTAQVVVEGKLLRVVFEEMSVHAIQTRLDLRKFVKMRFLKSLKAADAKDDIAILQVEVR